jgi:hypothetical protein
VLEHEIAKLRVKALIDMELVKNGVKGWIYARNSEARVGLDNNFVRLKKGKKGKT